MPVVGLFKKPAYLIPKFLFISVANRSEANSLPKQFTDTKLIDAIRKEKIKKRQFLPSKGSIYPLPKK